MHLLPIREDGEDAVQDALLLGYRKLHQFRGEAQFSTWMHSILFNAARSLLRRQKARLSTLPIEGEIEGEDTPRSQISIADHRPNPEEEFRRAETFRLVSQLLKALPPSYQAVVALCEIEGLGVKEAAERLNRRAGTVKSQLHRARRLISKQVRYRFAAGQTRHPMRSPLRESARSIHAISRLKLQPNPIPEPIWGFSAYRLLRGGSNWQQIRRDCLASSGHRCSVCASTWGPLRCHPEWEFNDGHATAKMIGFAVLCSSCDAALHLIGPVRYGRADLAVRQISQVNRITLEQAHHVFQEALRIWNVRNGRKWHLTVSTSLLDRYPQLNVLNSVKEGGEERRPLKFAGVRLRRQLTGNSLGIPLAAEG